MKRRLCLQLVAAALIACATAAFAEESAPAQPPIKGNPKSKVYHKATCRYYKAKASTVEFKTEADAAKAGYQPCKQCAAPKKEKKTEPQTAAKKSAPAKKTE